MHVSNSVAVGCRDQQRRSASRGALKCVQGTLGVDQVFDHVSTDDHGTLPLGGIEWQRELGLQVMFDPPPKRIRLSTEINVGADVDADYTKLWMHRDQLACLAAADVDNGVAAAFPGDSFRSRVNAGLVLDPG